jgi:hypothetical protein
MPIYFHRLQQVKDAGIKYILSIGKRQPMHIGHKRSLERILDIEGAKLVYVIGSTNLPGDPLFDPFTNPLNVEQQIEQFKRAIPEKEVIFLPILDVADMSKWGPSIVASLKEIGIKPEECAMHFVGKPEDKLKKPSSFALPDDKIVTLSVGQWLVEAMGYYGFIIWFDDEMKVDLNLSARSLRTMDLENLTDKQKSFFAAPDYLLNIAREARKKNLNKEGAITLEDLSLARKLDN